MPFAHPSSVSARLVLLASSLAMMAACGGASAPSGATPKAQTAAIAVPAPAPASGEALPIGDDDPSWGSPDATVVMVEFSDFECPYCARAQRTIEAVKEAYGKERLRIVWKNAPLRMHPNARGAAEAAEGVRALAGNDAFWTFHDRAFAAQDELGDAAYAAWAKDAGVSPESFSKGLRARAWRAKVERDLAVGARLHVDGTPTFFINGEELTGAQPLPEFRRVIDAAAKAADARVASGTPRRDVARLLTAENVAKPRPRDDDEGEEAPAEVQRVALGASPSRGPSDARVTVVEFGDFECPYTKKVEPVIAAFAAAHPADVRVVWKDEPLAFHPRAEPAAELAYEARAQKGDAAFWAAHDRLLEIAPHLEDADLEGVAKSIGLDVAKARRAIATHAHRAAIEADQLAADDLGVRGTPMFFVNGRKITGAQPMERFEQAFAEEKPRVDALLAAGVAKGALYDALIKDGKGPKEPERSTAAFPAGPVPSRGGAKAKVTIVEIADFQCPYCKRAEPTLKEVLAGYGDRVRLEWRHMPLPMHRDAELAAEAASEAFRQRGAGGFWKMHDLLFANTDVEHGLERPALDGYAKQIGLDMAAWGKALDGRAHQAEIARDADAARSAGITGTPTFLVNGYVLTGAQPARLLRRLVDRALAEAK